MSTEIVYRVLTGLLTFSMGIFVQFLFNNPRVQVSKEAQDTFAGIGLAERTEVAPVTVEYVEIESVIDVPEVSKRDYSNLRPSKVFWYDFEKHPKPKSSLLSRNRRLVSIGDAVYMLDPKFRVLWFWTSEGPPLTDHPVVDKEERVFIVAYDLIWRSLEASNGSKRWRTTASGRSVYSQIELYMGDMYFIVNDMQGYREGQPSSENDHDNLMLMKDDVILWSTEIPPGAFVKIRGKKVYIVSGNGKQRSAVRIEVPSFFEPSYDKIGRIEETD